METTLTIRADPELKQKLEEMAALQGKSVSQFVREVLEEAVAEVPMKERIGHLMGILDSSELDEAGDEWWEHIKRMNWRD